MAGKFRVSSPDGRSYFVSEIETLQSLYRSGQINARTLVQTPDNQNYRPLQEIVDIHKWSGLPSATDSASGINYHRGDNLGFFHERTNPGLRAAGVLLL